MGKLKDLFNKSQQEQAVQDAISQKYNQMLAQSMMNTKAAQLQNVYNTGVLGQAQIVGAIPSTAIPTPRKSRNPNDCEAYVMPLSSLVNLWRAKYGDKWVDVSEIDDEFWSDASARLHRNSKMEEADFNYEPWARLKEGA
jgi:hypothetical protein